MSRSVLCYATAAILAVLLVRQYHIRGGPYFQLAETTDDHVWVGENVTRDAILACRRAEPHLPPGAEVTVLIPSQNPNCDATIFLTAVGELPRQYVVGPGLIGTTAEDLPDYVIALRETLDHASYERLLSFPEGHLYAIRR